MSISTLASIGAIASMSASISTLQCDRISVASEKGIASCLTSFWEFAKISESKVVIDQLRELSSLSTHKIDHVTELSLKDLSGKSLENMSTQVRSIVFGFTSSMAEETKKRLLLVVREGKIHNRVKAALSDIDLAAMKKGPLTLNKVYFCQSSLASNPDSKLGKLRSIFVHEFLVVETEVEALGSKFKRCIRAEKFGFPPNEAGIVIQYAKECNKDGVRDCEKFEIDCGGDGGGKRITLEELEKILEDYEKDYSLKNSCCWDYAKDMSKNLLKFCMNLPETTPHEKERLGRELKSLEGRIRSLGSAVTEIVSRAGGFIEDQLKQLSSKSE